MNQYQQVGGVKCSLCGSDGTNKSTCPLNKDATAPNPSKHPNAVKMISTTIKTSAPATKVSPTPVKAKSPIKLVPMPMPTKAKSPVKPVIAAPSKDELDAINKIIAALNELETSEYWVDNLDKKYLLNMKDVDNLEKLYLIEPQSYESLNPPEKTTVGKAEKEYFRNEGGLAVTGSGSDTWVTYRPGMLKDLERFYEEWSKKVNDYDEEDKEIANDEEYDDYDEVQKAMKLDDKKITFGDVAKFVTLGSEAFDEEVYTKPIYAVEMRNNRVYVYKAAEPLIKMLNGLVGKKGPYIFMTSFAEHSGSPEELGANEIKDYYGNDILDYDMIEIGKPDKPITVKDIRDALKNYQNRPADFRSYFYEYASNHKDMNRIELGYGS